MRTLREYASHRMRGIAASFSGGASSALPVDDNNLSTR
jgi:hypothetical protein